MRWRILEDGQKVYTDRNGTIVGRVIAKQGEGHVAYHITPDRTKHTAGATKRERLGAFVEVRHAQAAVERRIEQ